MIKTRKWILCAVFVTALSACGQESSAPAETEKTPEVIEASPQIEDSSQNAGVKELDEAGMRKGIEAYASVMAETFGAEIDFGKPYASDEIANYYRVTNFSTVEEVREYITTLVDAKLIDEETSFRYDFEMKDGVLCAVRGGRGYGYYGIDTENWKKISDTSAEVPLMVFDEVQPGSSVRIDFAEIDGVWKVVSAVIPDGEVKNPPVRELDEDGMQKLIEAYASVMAETFGAEIDFTSPYSNDEIAQYYAVNNFSTVDEIRDYITTYVDEKIIDEKTSFLYDFLMVDNTLCAVRGGRGYSYYGIDADSWKKSGDTSALVQFMILDEPQKDRYVQLDFQEENGMWKVIGAILPEGY